MSGFVFKTRAEQLLEWLYQQQKTAPLTNEEWEQVRRCEHSIYCRARRQADASDEVQAA